jgi:hypothetical protein
MYKIYISRSEDEDGRRQVRDKGLRIYNGT